jgi:hypothetical protein
MLPKGTVSQHFRSWDKKKLYMGKTLRSKYVEVNRDPCCTVQQQFMTHCY